MCRYLSNEYNKNISRDMMRSLYNKLRIRAIYQKPRITLINKDHKV